MNQDRILSPEYVIALQVHDRAVEAYNAARLRYRGMLIGDAEFLAARKAYVAANAAFDAAFDAEVKRA